MDIEKQEQKFDQSLDQVSHSTTRLTNTLVCHATERSPQLHLKTKLHLLSCIGGLSVQSGGEGATSQERVVLFSTKSRISID